MFFSLDVLRARKGDCLMLHYGSEDDPQLMLIDGGPSKVYGPHLKPRIAMVHAARGLEETDPLPVDVVMVSHVDDDHIRGLIELTEEQRGATPEVRLDVTSLWHNTFDDLLSTKPDELMAGFGAASILAGVNTSTAFDGVELPDEPADEKEARRREIEAHQTIEVLASIAQGRTLRDNAKELEWTPNHKFKGKLILATDKPKVVKLAGDLEITVAGPMQAELEALQEAHDEWLREQKAGKKKSAEAMLAAFVDESVPNLSSIVVLVECDGKSMLLTGDARGDKILEGLELVGLLAPDGKRHFDILKGPHHGSDNNVAPIFFERLTADHYVFSGDGEHGNPERATLEMLLNARGDDDYTIHLTYPIDEIDAGRKKDWEKEQAKEKARKKKNPATKKPVRENWSHDEHSLAALFADNPKFGAKVKIVQEGEPHMIDLLDPVEL